jgi:replicative DNA helicase
MVNVRELVDLICDCHTRRTMINIAQEMLQNATSVYDAGDDNSTAVRHVECAERRIYSLAEKHSSFVKEMPELVEKVNITIKKARESERLVHGIDVGFRSVNTLLGGLHNSDLIIIAARPSMGKTAFAINVALSAAEFFTKDADGGSVGFFSLEMSDEQIVTRMISTASGVVMSKMKQGVLMKSEQEAIAQASKRLRNLPIHISDASALTVESIRITARNLKRTKNMKCLFIDYLQLMKGVNYRNQGNRVNEITEITQGLKALAKDLNIPIVVLSQLSRAVETRDDKRPQLSDLRDSGSIEQDADIVMFIYMEEYYEMRNQPDPSDPQKMSDWKEKMASVTNEAELIVAKHRNGPIGNIKLKFFSATNTFRDSPQ